MGVLRLPIGVTALESLLLKCTGTRHGCDSNEDAGLSQVRDHEALVRLAGCTARGLHVQAVSAGVALKPHRAETKGSHPGEAHTTLWRRAGVKNINSGVNLSGFRSCISHPLAI